MNIDQLMETTFSENDSGCPDTGILQLGDEDTCYIDDLTARNLELVVNCADSSNRKQSLFGFLNENTSTTTGSRILRESILRPLCHLDTLEHRLDCIEFLVDRKDALGSISNSVRRYGQNVDLDRVVPVLQNLFKARGSTLSLTEKRLEALTTLEVLVSYVDELKDTVGQADQKLLSVFRNALDDPAFADISRDIHNLIDVDSRISRGKRSKVFRIKQGVESLFDIARSTYNVAISDLEQYVHDLQREDGLPWKLSYTETRGYYLVLNVAQVPKGATLGPRYVQVNQNRTTISCTTKDLMQSNVRANVSYENSMKLANELLVATISMIINNLEAIEKLVNVVGHLDMLTCLAKLVVHSDGILVRPKFTASETIIVKGRHPVLERVLMADNLQVVPNDIMFSTGHKNFMLVTGPNMGGKSIFLKQVAIIQIMAQIGCYVPAESAHIKLMNRIVVRSGISEDSQSSCSSFMWEMRAVASAINREQTSINQSALYVIDEIGRGTTIDDGASYSFAIAEELALRRHSFTVFATHFDQVFSLTNLYGNIMPYHFKYTEDQDGKLKISHNLIPGFPEKSHYGIKLAEAIGLPEEILVVARRGIDQAM